MRIEIIAMEKKYISLLDEEKIYIDEKYVRNATRELASSTNRNRVEQQGGNDKKRIRLVLLNERQQRYRLKNALVLFSTKIMNNEFPLW